MRTGAISATSARASGRSSATSPKGGSRAIASIPTELWGKREAAELYHELLEHRWYQSQRKGRDVGRDEALRSYVDFLRSLPDERRVVLRDDA